MTCCDVIAVSIISKSSPPRQPIPVKELAAHCARFHANNNALFIDEFKVRTFTTARKGWVKNEKTTKTNKETDKATALKKKQTKTWYLQTQIRDLMNCSTNQARSSSRALNAWHGNLLGKRVTRPLIEARTATAISSHVSGALSCYTDGDLSQPRDLRTL